MNDMKIINEIKLAEDEFAEGAIIEARDRLLNIINVIDIFLNKEETKMTKGELFSASVRCPKCGKAMHMRVSDIPEYAYQCIECDEDFYSIECSKTVSDCSDENGDYISLWEITLRNKDTEWYTSNKDILNQICDKYDVYFMGCDNYDKNDVFIDFGWKESPSTEQIQNFTDEIMELL